jgi:selenocysteine lyase/cysteine desulfurase
LACRAWSGLEASLRWLLARGVQEIQAHEADLTRQLIEGLTDIPGVAVYGGRDVARQTATVSFTISGRETSEIGMLLDEDHGIMCRVGLHCAPAAHKTMGTFPHGTVRFGLGAFNTAQEVETALAAVRTLSRER